MPAWKKNIFIRVITARMTSEQRTAEDIIAEYVDLTDDEKAKILLDI